MPTVPRLAKIFSYICTFSIVIFLLCVVPSPNYEKFTTEELMLKNQKVIDHIPKHFRENVKYILQWTPGLHSPFDMMGKGFSAFVTNGCKYANCYVTDDKNYFLDPRNFDVVVFHGKEIFGRVALPTFRSPKQKFIFATMESAHNYPDPSLAFENYFNWTWTYRIDSDVRWGYISVYNESGEFVAPKRNVIWRNTYEEVNEDTVNKLKSKKKAAAWFVSNCQSKSKREHLAESLAKELKKYNLDIDIFGKCGTKSCPRNDEKRCAKMLSDDYYFYLSFENSCAEDYVTEKVLTALDNYAVPIVHGGANYSRFLPPGSYLNARELGADELAFKINYLINNKSEYYKYFRWRNHYKYELTSANKDVCNLCELLNNNEKLKKKSVYKYFKKWWNPPDTLC